MTLEASCLAAITLVAVVFMVALTSIVMVRTKLK